MHYIFPVIFKCKMVSCCRACFSVAVDHISCGLQVSYILVKISLTGAICP